MRETTDNSILKQRRYDAALAIVGIGCRFPGGVNSHASFWTMLQEGRQGIGDIPADRIDVERYYDPTLRTPGKMSVRLGGYLPDIDQFDHEFFGLSPHEAERMDPQHRLLLEASWEAFEDAGLDPLRLRGGKVGVFVGQWVSDFEQRLFLHPEELDFPMTLGSGRYASSGRISYLFGFTGPSMTIDTACSSSLVAVHLALQSLRTGESDLAIAGGVNLILGPHIHVAYSQGGMMAPNGQCKFGDALADGYVRSEGAGIVALKRLEDALRDGDRIHAVIRGSAVNNDGASSGSMGRPSVDGQRAAIEAALADAQVDALEVGYVEAHGTGTPAGDRVEIGHTLAGRVGQDQHRSHRERSWDCRLDQDHAGGS
jgi:acyl transferase domain-containing protein